MTGSRRAAFSWADQAKTEKPTPLPAKIDQMLTEARVILPGAQALLGFQLTVTLTRAFEQLPEQVKLLHATSLCCVGFAVILLMIIVVASYRQTIAAYPRGGGKCGGA